VRSNRFEGSQPAIRRTKSCAGLRYAPTPPHRARSNPAWGDLMAYLIYTLLYVVVIGSGFDWVRRMSH